MYDVRKPRRSEIKIVSSLGRLEPSLTSSSPAGFRAFTLRHISIFIFAARMWKRRSLQTLSESLILHAKLANLVRLLDGTVVVAFANDEIAVLRMTAGTAS